LCVLTFFPYNGNGFLLTSNRDESPLRKPAYFPEEEQWKTKKVVYPKDGEKGGTWFGATTDQSAICLLNGAFAPHEPKPPYRKSRGLVVLDALNARDFRTFSRNYDFTGIEPFSMVSIEWSAHTKWLSTLTWDGSNAYYQQVDPKVPHIWASAGLYTPEARESRSVFFQEQLAKYHKKPPEVFLQWHQALKMGNFTADYGENGELPPVNTLSITQLLVANNKATLFYRDLTNGQTTEATIL